MAESDGGKPKNSQVPLLADIAEEFGVRAKRFRCSSRVAMQEASFSRAGQAETEKFA